MSIHLDGVSGVAGARVLAGTVVAWKAASSRRHLVRRYRGPHAEAVVHAGSTDCFDLNATVIEGIDDGGRPKPTVLCEQLMIPDDAG